MKNFFVLLCLSLFLSSCICMKPENADLPQCVATRVVVDCSKTSALDTLPTLLPLVKWVLAGAPGGQMDWDSLLKSLMSMGFEMVSCTADQLDNAFTMKMAKVEKAHNDAAATSQSNPDYAAENLRYLAAKREAVTYQNNWKLFLSKHYPNVKFKHSEAGLAKMAGALK